MVGAVASTGLPAEATTIAVAQTSTAQATAAVAVGVVVIEPSHATLWPNTAIASSVNLANSPTIPLLKISVKWVGWAAVNSGAKNSADQAVMVVWVVALASAAQAALVGSVAQVASAVQAAQVASAVQAAMTAGKWARTPAAHSTPLTTAWDLCKTLLTHHGVGPM